MKIKTITLLFICTLFSTLLSTVAFAESRCSIEEKTWFKAGKISCSYQSVTIASSNITSREVKYQVPLGEAPYWGWPVAIIYQETSTPIEFTQKTTALFGAYYEANTTKRLLDSGYCVLPQEHQLN